MTRRWAPVIALGIATPVMPSGCKHQDEVQMQHGNQPSNAATPSPAPTPALRAQPPKVSWRAPVAGTAVAPPVVAGGLVIVATTTPGNARGAGSLEAFDVATGAPRWRFDRDGGLDGGVASTPVVADGRIVFGTSTGTVHALDVATGQPAWKATIGTRALAGVAVRGGVVYAVGQGTTVHAIDLRTGTSQWEGPAGTGAYAAPATTASEIYVASEDGTLRALAPTSGAVTWQISLSESMPVAVTTTKDPVLVSLLADRSLRAVDATTRAERWAFTSTSSAGAASRAPVPAIARDTVAVVDGASLVGLALATGAQSWTAAIGDAVVPPLAADDVVFAAGGGQLHAVDATSGAILWSLRLEQPATSGLCLQDARLYLVDGSRQLVALAF